MKKILFLGSPEREEVFIEGISANAVKNIPGHDMSCQLHFVQAKSFKEVEFLIQKLDLDFVAIDLQKIDKDFVGFVPLTASNAETILNAVKAWFDVSASTIPAKKHHSRPWWAGNPAFN